MKDIEENDIFIFYLPMVIAALLIQLVLAWLILRPYKDILECTVWSDKENRSFWESTRKQWEEDRPRLANRRASAAENHLLHTLQVEYTEMQINR